MATLKTLQTTTQYMFFPVYQRCSGVSSIISHKIFIRTKTIILKAVWIQKKRRLIWKWWLHTRSTLFFYKNQQHFAELQCSYFFRQFQPQAFLFLPLFIHALINCNMYTWQLLNTWPIEKAGNFPFQNRKKEILKNFPKYKYIVHNKLLIDSKRLLWYIFLFLTEHNPSFTLFLNCSYFFTESELRCSYKLRSY